MSISYVASSDGRLHESQRFSSVGVIDCKALLIEPSVVVIGNPTPSLQDAWDAVVQLWELRPVRSTH